MKVCRFLFFIFLISACSNNKEKSIVLSVNKAYPDSALAQTVDSIYREIEKVRPQIESNYQSPGIINKETMDYLLFTNYLCMKSISRIIDTTGWPGPERIGENANEKLFLIIQHSNLQFQEKYFPVMKEAVKLGKARKQDLALLEDRILVAKNKKQIYGSQVVRDLKAKTYTLCEIEDEKNVNKRRDSMGLEPLEKYLQEFGIRYNPPK